MLFPSNSVGSSYPRIRAAERFEKRQVPSESQPQIASVAESRIKWIRSIISAVIVMLRKDLNQAQSAKALAQQAFWTISQLGKREKDTPHVSLAFLNRYFFRQDEDGTNVLSG